MCCDCVIYNAVSIHVFVKKIQICTKCKQFIFTLGGRGNWTTDGCELIEIDGNAVTCRCNHLTNFGCLVVCRYNNSLSSHELPF